MNYGSFVLIGLPTFSYNTDLFAAPTGQIAALKRLGPISYPDLYLRLQREYIEIGASVHKTGMDWAAAICYRDRIDPVMYEHFLHGFGSGWVGTYDIKPSELIAFSRDLAVWAPNGNCLINELALVDGPLANMQFDQRIIPSPYGEGGRVLHIPSSDVAIVFDEYADVQKRQTRLIKPPVRSLLDNGFRVGFLPVHTSARRTKKGWHLIPERHPDRVAGLVMGLQNDLHLITFSRDVNSGYRDDCHRSRYGPEATMDRYKRTCDRLEIALHVIDEPVVPMSCGFAQFSNGKVIMSRGDSAIRAILEGIVGRDNLIMTRRNISHYPRYALAGVRCLVNELPNYFLNAIELPDEEFKTNWQDYS